MGFASTPFSRTMLVVATLILTCGMVYAWSEDILGSKPGDVHQIRQTTRARDFIGRWGRNSDQRDEVLVPEDLMIDISPCGADLCGVAVSSKGECLQKILELKDRGPDKEVHDEQEESDRFSGQLMWANPVEIFDVAADIFSSSTKTIQNPRPKPWQIQILGYRAGKTFPEYFSSRNFPVNIELYYQGKPICLPRTS